VRTTDFVFVVDKEVLNDLHHCNNPKLILNHLILLSIES